MKNVVVTGMGIISCIGSGLSEVLSSLKNGKSGIKSNPTYKEMCFRSHVSGSINVNLSELIDGIYIARIKINNSYQAIKFIKH